MLATIGIKNNEANKAPNHSRDLFAKFWAEKNHFKEKKEQDNGRQSDKKQVGYLKNQL
jgi:hypothetical protein